MELNITSENSEETKQIAKFLINYLQDSYPHFTQQALVISLEGELGVGKTEFMKGIAQGLNLQQHIFSPTYLLMKSFPIPNSSYFQTLWHLDCYRLKSIQEIKLLGIEDILTTPENMVFIEWGDKIKQLLPSQVIRISFSYQKNNTRLIRFSL